MSWHGDWFGEFHGDWFGPVEQVPGTIYGSATISVSAAGVLVNGNNVVSITGGRRRPRVFFEPATLPQQPLRPRDRDEDVALLIALG